MTSLPSSPELLEHRIAPALAFALDANHTLLSFDLGVPDEILSSMAISGLIGGDAVLGMDFRPSDGKLYAISSGARLYSIDPGNGQATMIAALSADPTDATDPFAGLTGSFFGIDINPVTDRIRLVSDTGENFQIHPDTGSVITDDVLAFAAGDSNFGAAPGITGAAYTNSYLGATSTTLYALDAAHNALVLINPTNGAILTLGALGVDPDAAAAFEIAPNSTDAFAIMTVSGVTGLYEMNLGSGSATFMGAIGKGTVGMRGFVILPGDLTLLNHRTATYVDADGDRVTVKVSKGELSANDFRLLPLGPKGAQLATLNLSDDGGEFAGAKITIQAARPAKGGSGDGFVNVGEILADVDLGKVKVKGDLGRIRAGDNVFENNRGVGLKSLQVHSLGLFGTDTGAQSIISTVAGGLKKLQVQTDLAGSLSVSGLSSGDIGSIRIGGSLSGGAEDSSGRITATGDIGRTKIGGDIRAGAGIDTGRISAGAHLASLTVGGSLDSGSIFGHSLGKITIKGSVTGAEVPGKDHAAVSSLSTIGKLKIKGDVTGYTNNAVVILAGSTPSDARRTPTIGKIEIGGSASHLNLLAGFSSPSTLTSGDAEIGKVVIKGNFIASNIVAGVRTGADGFWGTADDALGAQMTSSRIASILIKGQAAGTDATGDHFGIVAQAIGKVRIGGVKLAIPQSIAQPAKTIGWSGDLAIRVV